MVGYVPMRLRFSDTGQLICVGNDPKDVINCVGFNNLVGTGVFYVTVAPIGEAAPYASYKMLMGQPGPLVGQRWPCTVA